MKLRRSRMRKLLINIFGGSSSFSGEGDLFGGSHSGGGGVSSLVIASEKKKKMTPPDEVGLDQGYFKFLPARDDGRHRITLFGIGRLMPEYEGKIHKNVATKFDKIVSVYKEMDGISVQAGLGCAFFYFDKNLRGDNKRIKVIEEKLSKIRTGPRYKPLKEEIANEIKSGLFCLKK